MTRQPNVRQHRLTRRLFGAIFRLPRPHSHDIAAELDFAIPMLDASRLQR
jgi:hypothetical protein